MQLNALRMKALKMQFKIAEDSVDDDLEAQSLFPDDEVLGAKQDPDAASVAKETTDTTTTNHVSVPNENMSEHPNEEPPTTSNEAHVADPTEHRQEDAAEQRHVLDLDDHGLGATVCAIRACLSMAWAGVDGEW